MEIHPWKRFWCRSDGAFSLTPDGYLTDPEDRFTRLMNPDIVPFEDIMGIPCLALLGEPGIGKSTVMLAERTSIEEAIHVGGDKLLWLDLKEYGDESRLVNDIFECDEFEEWLDGAFILHLFLDSLDECRIYIPNVANLLLARLRKHKEFTDRLRLRIACRTADWPITLQSSLPDLWGEKSFGAYELVPLRRKDVRIAAEAAGVDGDTFLDEVQRTRAQAFAIKPVTHRLLLNIYRKGKRLPETQAEIYEQGCRVLCEETSESRRDANAIGTLSAHQRLIVATRIAAFTIFCKKSAIYTNVDTGEISNDDMTIAMLAGDKERVGDELFHVGETEIKETLRTGLFSGRGPHRLGFAHQTYAEFLAARYLIERNLDLTQILSLILHKGDDEKQVAPQLAETVAWLAGMKASVFRAIMDSDPQVLLRSDVAKAGHEERNTLVESLLLLFDAEKLTDFDWGLHLHYRKLKHPLLPTQLEPYIQDRDKGIIVRRVAIDIAEACEVRELQELLADIALDPSEDRHIRHQAAHAVAEIADEGTKLRLKPLAVNPNDDDPDDELKGDGLRALWPNLISAKEVFSNLSLRKRESFHGSYSTFISHDLPSHLTVADLPVALDWVAREIGRPLHSAFRTLIGEIFIRASQHLDIPAILNSLAKALAAGLERYHAIRDCLSSRARKDQPHFLAHLESRRMVVAAMLPLIQDPKKAIYEFCLDETPLVRQEDLHWLIERLHAEDSDAEAQKWAVLIRNVFGFRIPDHFDAVYYAAEANPVLRSEIAHWIEPIRLDSPEAEKLRQQHAQMEQWKQEKENPPPLDPPPAIRIQTLLDQFDSGDFDAWWRLVMDMTLEPTSTHYREHEVDLATLPGWESADLETRSRIITAARRYLIERDAKPDDWLGKDVSYRPATAGYKALFLLTKEAPNFVENLPSAVWRKWAPIIIGYPSPIGTVDKEGAHLELIHRAYEHAPEVVIETLMVLIDRDNDKHGHLFDLRKVLLCWDERLCAALMKKVKDDSLKPRCIGDLLDELLEHGCREAQDYAASLIQLPLPSEERERSISHAAAAALLTYTDDAGWPTVWSAIQRDEGFGREVITTVVRARRNSGRLLQRVAEEQAADLYIWLARQFPHAKDDPQPDGTYTPSTRMVIADYRDAVLRNLRERGTPEACQAISRIVRELPELEWLKWTLLEAKKTMRRHTWEPLTPDQLRDLTRIPGSRLVQSGGELLGVLVESFRRLEEKLQGETPATPDIWNEVEPSRFRPKDENHLSDYIKRHLEQELRQRGIIALREVEIRRGEGTGQGERTDIHISGVIERSEPDYFDKVSVIIEVKGCWHDQLKTAMKSQLVDRYMKDNACGHGLYVVGWFTCAQWDPNDSRLKKTPSWQISKARQFFEQQSRELSNGEVEVASVVLNTALR